MPPRGCARRVRTITVSDQPSRPRERSRRELLGAALTVPLWRAWSPVAPAQARAAETRVTSARGFVVGAGDADVSTVEVTRNCNWTDAPVTLSARLTRASTVTDFWSGAALGRQDVVTIADMPAHSARLLECRDV